MQTTFDFQDGKGPVPARRHINLNGKPGGWVAETAHVDKTCYIHYDTYVYDFACVEEKVFTFGPARIYGNAVIKGDTQIFNECHIFENAIIKGKAFLMVKTSIFGNTYIEGYAYISNSKISSNNQIAWGNFYGFTWTLTKDLLTFHGHTGTIKWWEAQKDEHLYFLYESNTIVFFIKNLLILSKTLE